MAFPTVSRTLKEYWAKTLAVWYHSFCHSVVAKMPLTT